MLPPYLYRMIVSLFVILIAVPGVEAQERGGSGQKDECDSLCIVPTRTISFDTSEGTQMNVDVSPDGETILFDLLGDIYTVPRTGGTATRLTSGMAMDLQPVFSPEGGRVLFVSDRSGNENLWTIDADGANPTPVTTERGDSRAGRAAGGIGDNILISGDSRFKTFDGRRLYKMIVENDC